ncbi:NifU family protein [Persicobacter psychrovividus]|uniref:NifU family protein n=1 Tax=Persicobacter psychrovividus TaxID=387638 RepID=A0ABM7VDN0_9BACT|nr:NifU family protein [Persicobacter psychrovividus]
MKESPLLSEVELALESIRPYLESDGGNVKVVEIIEDHTVKVELIGACGSCPMSPMTMKAGIEEAIKKQVPSIKEVIAINLTPLSK